MDPWGTPRATVKRAQEQKLVDVLGYRRREALLDAWWTSSAKAEVGLEWILE